MSASGFDVKIVRRVEEHMDLIVNGVKVTFFQYPFEVAADCEFGETFKLPSLISLAAMKAYALGRRSKWKDYVDLYFLLTKYFTLESVAQKAAEMFGPLFSEKQFRAQLSYFDDVDYSEQVNYLIKDPPSGDEIRAGLTKISLAGV